MTTALAISCLDEHFQPAFDITAVPPARETLAVLSQRIPSIHQRAKRIPEIECQKVLGNEPFGDFSRAVYAMKTQGGDGAATATGAREYFRMCACAFLRNAYAVFEGVDNIVFDISGYDEKGERAGLNQMTARYKASGLVGQATALEEQYSGFSALRRAFEGLEKDAINGFDAVIPTRFLPEMLCAAPVWFIDSKFRRAHPKRPPVYNNPEVTFFCDIVGSKEFANLFQMYNRLPLGFADFRGDDLMPAAIAELITRVRGYFDFMVIATPYHDLATKEWRDARWQRNVDPFLFGFLKHLPQWAFFLGRWSGTGFFPLVTEMIADTVGHIRTNRGLLRNFGSGTPWYKGGGWGGNAVGESTVLRFADELLRAYERSRLFPFLHGEQPVTS